MTNTVDHTHTAHTTEDTAMLENTDPNTNRQADTPAQTNPRMTPGVVGAIAVAAAAAAITGTMFAVVIADRSAEAGDRQLRTERSVQAQLADACMHRQVGWACGVDRVEFQKFNDAGSLAVVHLTEPSEGAGAWKHEPPTGPDFGYSDAAREILRTAPVGTYEAVIVNHSGAVVGHSGMWGPAL